MAATEISRRPDFDPFPPPSALSAPMPVTVNVSTVVVRSGTAKPAHARVLHAHGQAQDDDEGVADGGAEGVRAHQGEDHGDGQEQRLHPGGHGDVMAPVLAEPGHDPPTEDGPQPERHQRHERRHDGEALGSRDREAEEDDVARHVGHEHVTEQQVAERIDEPGEHRHGDQQWRQGAKAVGAVRSQGLADLGEECVHVQAPLGPYLKGS